MANLTLDSSEQLQLTAPLQSEWQDIQAKLAKLEAEATYREADFKRLVGEGFISSHATQDKTRLRVELERALTTPRAKAAYKMETLRTLSDRHGQASAKYSQVQLEATKARKKNKPSSPPWWQALSSNWPATRSVSPAPNP